MGAALSMASVNKIKELANQREYSLALDIVDSQDLTKSLNPQFLKLCGDIYCHAKRYTDARKVLVMAHRLAPESKRVIASLVGLYLSVGYEQLAKRYFDIYMFDADSDALETRQLKYMYDNAYKKSPKELLEYLESAYSHNMDYDWSYTTYLLLKAVSRDEDAKALAEVYLATYKNTEYAEQIATIEEGADVNELIYVYADEWCEDDSEAEEAVRCEEAKLLEIDENRIHPKEAEITIMYEEVGDASAELSKRKLKKLLKEQEKQEREAAEKAALKETEASSEDSLSETEAVGEEKGSLFKKIFKKNNKSSDKTEDNTEDKTEDNEAAEDIASEAVDEASAEETATEDILVNEDTTVSNGDIAKDDGADDIDHIATGDAQTDSEETVEDEAGSIKESVDSDVTFVGKKYEFSMEDADIDDDDEVDADTSYDVLDEPDSVEAWDVDDGENNMKELHLKGKELNNRLFVSVDDESDDFAAESDTIDDLSGDADYSNPFEDIGAVKKTGGDSTTNYRMSFTFEDAELDTGDEDDDVVDDFSTDIDEEFGYMEEEPYKEEAETYEETEEAYAEDAEPSEEYVEQSEDVEPYVEEAEPSEEHIYTETSIPDAEPTDTEEDYTSDSESADVEEEDEHTLEDISDIAYDEAADEYEEADEAYGEKAEMYEEAAESYDDDVEPYEEAAESYDEDVEPYVEDVEPSEEHTYTETSIPDAEPTDTEDDYTSYSESADVEEEDEHTLEDISGIAYDEAADEYEEADEAYDEETEPSEEHTGTETSIPDAEHTDTEEKYAPDIESADIEDTSYTTESYRFKFESKPSKKKLDFPVFKTDLFPEYNVKEVENNFDQLMEEAQGKMRSNNLKEEQMLKEAEALLASLGIDVKSGGTANTDSAYNLSEKTKKDDKTSRDALKASLKIDAVKIDILKKLKGYR